MPTGTVLDVGCGDGADAEWLARQGCDATAIDVSGVAVERSRHHVESAGGWVHFEALGLLEAVAERALIDAVAPGGVLLVIHHADIDRDQSREHGFDPDDYVSPSDVAALLDEGWRIEVDEHRARTV